MIRLGSDHLVDSPLAAQRQAVRCTSASFDVTALRRYWFPAQGFIGVGVTVYSETEAATLAARVAEAMGWTPLAVAPIVDLDASALDENHVRMNLGVPSERDVWFRSKSSICERAPNDGWS